MKRFKYVLVAFAVTLFAVGLFAPQSAQHVYATEITAEQVAHFDYLTNGVAVLDNGTICAAGGQSIKGFDQSGTSVFSINLPAKCGNVCAYGDYLFAAGYMSGHMNELYVLKPGEWTSYKLLKTGQRAQAVTVDYDGNLYCVNGSGTIKRAKVADVVELSSGAEINWTETYKINYTRTPYTQGIAVDGRGNIYIADKGSYNGYDVGVLGIYKYVPATDDVSFMYFTAGNSHRAFTWVYDICADEYGTVAVVGRNNKEIAVFRPGSTSADIVKTAFGMPEGVGRDKAGNIYFNATNGGSSQEDARFGIYKIDMSNVAVTGVSLSPATRSVEAGKSFTLKAVVNPSDATNQEVMYSSSNTSVATVEASGKVTGVKEGTVMITAKTVQGRLTATCKVTVNKAPNPLAIKAKTATVKYSKIKKKTQTLDVTKVIAFTRKGQGKMTYTKASGNKKITIAKTTGKVIIKKGLKKGTYKVKVKVKAAGNATYRASAVKAVTFKIKIK